LVWLVRDVAKNPRKNWWIIAVWVCGVFVTLLGVVILRKHFVSNLPMPYVTPQPEMYEIMVKVLKDPMNPSLGTKMVPKMVYDVSADAYILWALVMPTILCVLIWLWMRLRRPGRSAMIFIWAAFIACSLGLIMIINPSPTRQEQEITLKFFAPSHGFFAMLIGYGIVITAAALGKLAQKSRDSGDIVRILAVALCALCLAMPFVTYSRNRDLCSVSKFDFGYQFGYRMFNPGGGYPDMPENAVLYGGTDPGRFVPTYMIFCESFVKPEDRYVSPFLYTGTNATERAAETERMKAFDRRDVYIITQNALADKTYMNYIRDHYGHERPDPANEETLRKYMDWNDKKKQWEKTLQYHIFQWGWKSLGRDTTYPKEPIRIPTPKEGEAAFEEYVRDVQAGRRVDMGGISMEGGRMVVNGALAVMEINGILAKNIFDWNKDKHEFYIEESYPIQWMYPYLRPYGVILKIEKNPLPAPQRDKDGALTGLWKEIVDLDTSYWNAIEADFLARDEFLRNPDARKSFAKLRSAIAGVYLQRSMRIEAEYAYNQAVRLCPIGAPDSYFNNAKTGIGGSEAGGQLMEIYMRTGRFDEALKLAEQYAAYDPFNNGMVGRLEQVRRIIKLNDDTAELKRQIDTNPQNTTFQDLLTFISNSLELNKSMDAWGYGQLIITNANTSLPALPPALLRLGKLYGAHNRNDMALAAFRKYATLKPEDPVGWVESGWALICQNRLDDGYRMWEQALQIGGAPIARLIAGDQRMNSFLVQQPRDGRFIKLLESALSPPPPPKPQLPPGPYLPK
ncbi:MAG: hypothetical protein FWG05_05435, partial [Kiritimatiellaeota bacterium]|nr:hypothetical protein [Kiritimatiellota bacterium]